MSRNNYSIRIPHESIEELKDFFTQKGLERREVKNTLWSYKGDNLFVNMYPSGVLLIQGSNTEEWVEDIVNFIKLPEGPLAGCDEVGKGDIFGPLVLCCAVIPPENFREVLKLCPKDSKNMKDSEIIKKAGKLSRLVNYKCINLMPERFNQLYDKYKNINRLMDDAYRKLIETLQQEHKPLRIVVDKYSPTNPFQDMNNLVFMEKGEKDIAVSVASIIARSKFLRKIRELEEIHGIPIPRGASGNAKGYAKEILKTKAGLAEKVIKTSFIQS